MPVGKYFTAFNTQELKQFPYFKRQKKAKQRKMKASM